MMYRLPTRLMMWVFLPVLLSGCLAISKFTADEITQDYRRGYGAGAEKLEESAPKPGRYLGYAVTSPGKAKLVAMLDLVLADVEGKRFEYKGVLKLALGGALSSEYVGTYIPRVVYDEGRLVFLEETAGLSLDGAVYKQGRLKARVYPEKNRDIGFAELDLVWRPFDDGSFAKADESAAGEPPLTDMLSGLYSGTCAGEQVQWQFKAAKWRGLRFLDGSLLGGYRIMAYKPLNVPASQKVCASGKPCANEVFLYGTYDLFTGALHFADKKNDWNCRRVADHSLACGSCVFKKAAESQALAQVRAAPVMPNHKFYKISHLAEPTTASSMPADRSVDDVYYGYLHHEDRDLYQLVAVNIPKQQNRSNETLFSGGRGVPAATLYFGEGDSSELITYRLNNFVSREISQEDGESWILDGGGDVFLVVTNLDTLSLRGLWFSKTYGRVGAISLIKNRAPALPKDLRLMPMLSGQYHDSDWEYQLKVSGTPDDEDPNFFPLVIEGWANSQAKDHSRRVIEEGVYDFYAGSIALRLDDGRMQVLMQK